MSRYTRKHLTDFRPRHDAFVGIDSDGCVFPSMDVKQKACFHPEIIRIWGLEAVERPLREVAEFINLHSVWRGMNRFTALLKTFEMLPGHPGVRGIRVTLPDTAALRRYIDSGVPLSNATLKAAAEQSEHPELRRVLDWSLAVNRRVEETVKQLKPFQGVREALALIGGKADLMVVSQTPEEALVREWQDQDLHRFPALIAGQELGTKAEHLALATEGRYAAHRVLMIGDAPGDLKAAREAGALFFPINPGREVESWRDFTDTVFRLFLRGDYAGRPQEDRIQAFTALLPETPPWHGSV